MKRLLASAIIAAGLIFAGCEKKDETAKDVKQAADKTASQAEDALNKTKSTVSDGVDQAKDAAASSMDMVEKQIDDLIAKAKAAVNDKKWSDAEGYIAQIKSLEGKLPQAVQDKINASLADVQKMIDAGKQLAPGK